jgi:tetratricopeptide (TPR) repeat protein
MNTNKTTTNELVINIMTESVSFNGVQLKLSKKWVRLYALLGYYHRRNISPVPIEKLHAISHPDTKISGFDGTIMNHLNGQQKKLQVKIFQGSKMLGYAINATTVKNVEFDTKVMGDVAMWLGLGEANHVEDTEITWGTDFTVPIEQNAASYNLMLAQDAVEHGLLPEAEKYANAVLEGHSKPHPSTRSQRLAAHCILLYIASIGRDKDAIQASEAEIDDLRLALEESLDPRDDASHLRRLDYAKSHLQIAKAYLTSGSDKELLQKVKVTLHKASTHLLPTDTRELAHYHATYSSVYLKTGEYLEGIQCADKALKQFLQERWIWGVQAMYAQIAILLRFEAERKLSADKQANKGKNSQIAEQDFQDKLNVVLMWLEKAKELCDFAKLGGSSELEIQLGRTYRLAGKMDLAKRYLDDAIDTAQKDGYRGDLALAWREYGNLLADLKEWEQAYFAANQSATLYKTIGQVEVGVSMEKRAKQYQCEQMKPKESSPQPQTN